MAYFLWLFLLNLWLLWYFLSSWFWLSLRLKMMRRFDTIIVIKFTIWFVIIGSFDIRLNHLNLLLFYYIPLIQELRSNRIILFIIYAILAFFTKGSVPIPLIPNITAPNENSATNHVVQSLNKVANGLTNSYDGYYVDYYTSLKDIIFHKGGKSPISRIVFSNQKRYFFFQSSLVDFFKETFLFWTSWQGK